MKTKTSIKSILDNGDDEEGIPAKLAIQFTGEISIDRDKVFETLRAIIKADYSAREYCRSIGYELPYDDKDVTSIGQANECTEHILAALIRSRVHEVLTGMERALTEKAGPVLPVGDD